MGQWKDFRGFAVAALLLAAGSAAAQVTVHETPEAPKKDLPSEWSAQLKAGFLLSSGNARSLSLSSSAQVARKWLGNKLAFEGGLAFARSEVRLGVDLDGSGSLGEGELDRVVQTTTQLWTLQGRYDRFFGPTDSAFLTAKALSDPPSGKQFSGSLQAGYSKQLFKSERHEALLEAGYDFTSETLTENPDAIAIHSARVLLGYALKFSPSAGANLKAEGLFNLNTEKAPNPRGGDTVGPLGDTRVNVSGNLTFALVNNLSFGVGVTLRYDHAPSPLPALALPYTEGYRPFADPVDLLTEAQLLYTFL